MNNPKTQKEMLLIMSAKMDVINNDVQKIAKDQFQLSCDFSVYINQQDLKNAKILSYLENDNTTNQKGLVEQVKINTFDINNIQIDKKIDKAKIGVIGVIIGAILTFVSKVFF